VTLAGRQLQVALSDGARQPVTAAHGTLTVQGGSRGATVQLALSEAAGGIYLGTLPPALRGEIAAQVDFEHSGARLSKQLLISLP